MKSIELNEGPVWDLPIRLFHWSIVLLIAFSWWTSEQGNDDLHFWSGHALLFLLIFRILWGFAGSSTARFAGFVRGPAALRDYLRTGTHPEAGHTPLGALSVVAMLLALLVQITTGLVQIDEDDFVEGPLSGLVSYDTGLLAHDVHEVSFNVLLGLIALHLAAILYYQLIRRRPLIRAMITGRAALPTGAAPMRPASARRFVAAGVGAAILTATILTVAPAFA